METNDSDSSVAQQKIRPDEQAALCPACRRFIGPLDTCPYCECPAEKPVGLKLLRRIAILLAVVGLCLVYAASISRDVHAMPIGDIKPVFNSARVRISGFAAENTHVRQKYGKTNLVSFLIYDGTNFITAMAFGNCAEMIAKQDCTPEKGDKMAVVGRLSLKAGKPPRIVIERPGDITIAGRENNVP